MAINADVTQIVDITSQQTHKVGLGGVAERFNAAVLKIDPAFVFASLCA